MQVTTRRLTDLWVVGREVTLDDGHGEITVWLQKMNPAEAADTNRRCDAARARVIAARGDPDSDEWQALHQSVLDYMADDRDRVRDYLLVEERAKATRIREAQVANNDRWSKDSLLQGLLDAWADDLSKRWDEDHDDLEAATIKAQLDAFRAEVDEAVDDDVALATGNLDAKTTDELIDIMTERLLQIEGSQAWLAELTAWQLFYGVRDSDDHKRLHFRKRAEVDELAPETFGRLRRAYTELEVDVGEGKDSPAPTSSSPSSEEPAEVGLESPSGLAVVSR